MQVKRRNRQQRSSWARFFKKGLRPAIILLCFAIIALGIAPLHQSYVKVSAQNGDNRNRSQSQSSSAQSNSASAEGGAISESALAQIKALDEEKQSRTPAQKKMDSQLVYAVKMNRGEAIAPGVQTLAVDVGASDNGDITVDISADIDDALLGQLQQMGVQVVSSEPQYHALRVNTSLDRLESIAALPQVRFVAPKQDAMIYQDHPADDQPAVNPTSFQPRADLVRSEVQGVITNAFNGAMSTSVTPGTGLAGIGSAESQGDLAHKAYSARGTFNVDGTGIRIGVLSDGTTNLAASQASGDLPPTCSSLTPPATEHCVNVVPGQTGSGDEGTAMMEIIHDVAPGAQLYFATANPTITQFAANINTLRNVYSCDIIVDDVGYFVESPFQDGQAVAVISPNNAGIVTQAVNDVVASGALYFSSAANSGNKNDNPSGTWEGDFVNGGTLALVPGGNLHDFDPTAAVAQSDSISAGSSSGASAPILLFWSDPLGASSNDYDLYVLNSTSTSVLGSSTNVQTGTQDPYERVNGVNTTGNRVVILQKTGAADRFLHLDTNRARLSFSTPGNTHGHNAASGPYGVAAVCAAC